MSLSQKPSLILYIISLFALSIQLLLWKSITKFGFFSRKDFLSSLLLLSLLSLPFSIAFNFSIIQLLWDVFIWSHSIHPYSVTPTDPLISKAQTALLFEYLPNKFELSTTPTPLLIGLKPLFYLYKEFGLFSTLIFSKIVIASIFSLFIDYAIPNKFKLFWLFNPIIWIFAISQADFSLLGFISFGFGLYYYQQKEIQNAYFIWGITALFGFEYILIILFMSILDKNIKYLMYSIASVFIWILLIWDNQAMYSYFFQSGISHSVFYKIFPLLSNYSFYFTILFYISLISSVLLNGALSNSVLYKSERKDTYFEWIRSQKNKFLMVIFASLVIIFYKSFNYTLIWSFFALVLSTQHYYQDHLDSNKNEG